MSRPVESNGSLPADDRYYCIPASIFKINEVLDGDLYLSFQGQYVLFKSRGQKWLATDEQKLSQSEVTHLYIMRSEKGEHYDFIDRRMETIFEDSKVTPKEKARILYQTSTSILKSIFEDPKTAGAVRRSVNFVRHCVSYLGRDHSSFVELF